jgi:hypothetical protein
MLLIFVVLTTQHITYTIDFDAARVQMIPKESYTEIVVPGCELSHDVGAPQLPVQCCDIALPYGARITGVNILDADYMVLEGEYLLRPVPAPVILSQKEITVTTEPRDDIYGSSIPYPVSCIDFKGSGVLDKQAIAELLFYPCQYIPAHKRIRVYTRVTLDIVYEGGTKLPARMPGVQSIVANPQDITIIPPMQRNGEFEYVIITNQVMDTVFQRLADWKTKKGIRAEVRTVSWIYANYTGEDNVAQIRNYLKTLADSSTQYCLLGGDVDVLPCRYAYAMSCSAGIWPGREDTMPSDLYFGDFQGTWDYDNDGSYGEIEDSVDLYPDILVGRAPVNTIAEAQKFVEKVLVYECNPDLTYLEKAMFSADILWSNPYTDMGVHKNRIENESFPPWYTVTKLYHSLGNLSPAAFCNALEQGQSLINHDGHGWIDVMGAGTGYLHNDDFEDLTNAPYYGILISIGCWTTAFDFGSIAEAFVNSTNGGGVAFIGNSSYGWGSPGNPGHGYSDRFDSRFFYSLLQEDNYHLGSALAHCKIHYIPFSREKNVYRWHQYQLNLLGDPELPVWTALPETLEVSAPQTIGIGNNHILITVRALGTGLPVDHALVCIMKGTETYASGYTDHTGSVFLDVTPTTTGSCDLTVTAHNYLMQESVIPVISGPYVNFRGWSFNDSLGNDDGIANPNEDIYIDILLKNSGTAQSNNITMTLRSSDAYVVVEDSLETVGTLNVNDSVYISNAFRIAVGAASNGYSIDFELEITDNAQTLIHDPTIIVGTPVFEFKELVISEPPTLPGDTETVYLSLDNTGYGYAHAPALTVTCTSPYVTLLDSTETGADIPPESAATLGPFIVVVDESCPNGSLIPLDFSITAETYSHSEAMEMLIGATGFSDDMESGSDLWTTGGSNNLWHISTRRSFSTSHSWYCGQEGSGLYNNNMNCYIQTVPFMINAHSLLRFYRWFHVPLYGTDGIYVIVMGSGFSDTLDFIGTGGALGDGGRAIQSNWFEEKFSLSAYPAGSTIQLRIAFISDNDGDVGEGFYIDDVNIEYVTFCEEKPGIAIPEKHFGIFPNPFSRSLSIQLGAQLITEGGTFDIFDATGRLVKREIFPPSSSAESHIMVWNARDSDNKPLPAGVYFVRFSTKEQSVIKKAVLLK